MGTGSWLVVIASFGWSFFVFVLAEEETKVVHIVTMFGEEIGLGLGSVQIVPEGCCRRGIHHDGKMDAEQDGNSLFRPTEDAVTLASTPALSLAPPNPNTMRTSMVMVSCVVAMALTMTPFPSDPPFTAAATFSCGINDASAAETIMMLDSPPESAAAAGRVPLPWLLTLIVGGGTGAAGSVVIDVELNGRIVPSVILCLSSLTFECFFSLCFAR